jgi:hypothetical protein
MNVGIRRVQALLNKAQTILGSWTFTGAVDLSGASSITLPSGIFEPTFIGSSVAGTPTYSVQQGFYIKQGRLVTVFGRVAITDLGSIAGNIRLGGMPFTVQGSTALGVVCQFDGVGMLANFTSATDITLGNVTTSQSYFSLYNGKTTTALTDANLTSTSQIRFSFSYITAS